MKEYELMSPEALIPYADNAKVHDDTQIRRVAASIERYGFVQPVVVDKDNVIVIGHCRTLAALRLGLEDVPVVRVEDLTDEEVRELRLVDNKTNESAWNMDLLNAELQDLDFGGLDFGFEEPEEEEEGVVEDGYEPEITDDPPRAQLGDVYQLGNHRLMCGDSTNPQDVDILTDGGVADLVFTDPPYGVSYTGTNNPNGREWDMIQNDDLRGNSLYMFLVAAFSNIKLHLKLGGAFYIWYANSNSVEFCSAVKEAGLKQKQIIIWHKGMVLGHSDYHWSYEPCIYGCHPEQNSTWYGDRTQKALWDMSKTELDELKKDELLAIVKKLYADKDVWDINRDNAGEYIHPTQKPIALAGKAIHNSSRPGDTVLDLFGGSGSTLMAAEQLGRTCWAMEYDPKYVDAIIDRWETYTGNTAIKLN